MTTTTESTGKMWMLTVDLMGVDVQIFRVSTITISIWILLFVTSAHLQLHTTAFYLWPHDVLFPDTSEVAPSRLWPARH